jgi:hypothetical protein
VSEWFKVTVLKTVVGQPTASSNLAPSEYNRAALGGNGPFWQDAQRDGSRNAIPDIDADNTKAKVITLGLC